MKKLFTILCIAMLTFLIIGCSTESTDLNKAVTPSKTQAEDKITKDEAVKIVMAQPEIKDMEKKGSKLEVTKVTEPTEEQPVWEIFIRESQSGIQWIYGINAFTGEVLGSFLEGEHEMDEKAIEEELVQNVTWLLENWQSFHYENYDPTRYSMAFALNFRLAYIFENFEENEKTVKEKNIVSKVEVKEIKDIGMAFNEEDESMYAQLRIMTTYEQEIQGVFYNEPVEVLVFAKKHLDGDEGWQFTNVDMYKVNEESEVFEKLFFGFKKSTQ